MLVHKQWNKSRQFTKCFPLTTTATHTHSLGAQCFPLHQQWPNPDEVPSVSALWFAGLSAPGFRSTARSKAGVKATVASPSILCYETGEMGPQIPSCTFMLSHTTFKLHRFHKAIPQCNAVTKLVLGDHSVTLGTINSREHKDTFKCDQWRDELGSLPGRAAHLGRRAPTLNTNSNFSHYQSFG